MTENDTTKRDAALQMLKDGTASPAEVAQLASVSRQLVNYWAAGIDWRKARAARLARDWRAALRG